MVWARVRYVVLKGDFCVFGLIRVLYCGGIKEFFGVFGTAGCCFFFVVYCGY